MMIPHGVKALVTVLADDSSENLGYEEDSHGSCLKNVMVTLL